MKGGTVIPIQDFIISLFYLKPDQYSDISIVRENDNTLHAYISTIPKEDECPICGGGLQKYGHGRTKTINNSLLKNQHCDIIWTPQKFRCKDQGAKLLLLNVTHLTLKDFLLATLPFITLCWI